MRACVRALTEAVTAAASSSSKTIAQSELAFPETGLKQAGGPHRDRDRCSAPSELSSGGFIGDLSTTSLKRTDHR